MEDFVHKLLSEDVAISETAWSSIFFDVAKSREIATFLKDQPLTTAAKAGDLLAAGARWSGVGWNTSRASRSFMP